MTAIREGFEYEFSRIAPGEGAHIDPPSIAVYETLVAKGPDRAAHPMMVDHWRDGEDRNEWILRTRPGLTFHSGAPCDAPAIVAALRHLRDIHGSGDQLWYWDPVDTVEALDEDTIRIRTHYPYGRLPSLLWGTHTAIHCEASRQRDPDAFGIEVIDGSGPYIIDRWSPTRLTGRRWDAYPGTPAMFIAERGVALSETIEWFAIPDETARTDALLGDDIDVVHAPDLTRVGELRDDPRLAVVEYPQPSCAYLALDWRLSELGLDDRATRQALSMAIDRDEIVRDALDGHGTAAMNAIPAVDEYHDPGASKIVFDRGRARRMLAEAGWRAGADGILARGDQRFSIACLGQDDSVMRRITEAAAKQLLTVGVELRTRYELPFKDFYEACIEGEQAIVSKWLWPDATDALIGFTATWGRPHPNWQHASSSALDDAYAGWLRAESHADLSRAASHVQSVASEELPLIPLVVPTDIWAFDRRLRGYRPILGGLYPFYQDATLSSTGLAAG